MAQKSCLSSYINLYLHIVFIIKTKGTYSEAETEQEQSPLLLAESTTSSSINRAETMQQASTPLTHESMPCNPADSTANSRSADKKRDGKLFNVLI